MAQRPNKLHPPFDALATRAGGVTELRRIMAGVPWSTIGRWSQQARDGETLPRSANLAITLAEQALAEKEHA